MAVINVTPLDDITALIASDNVNEGDVLLLEEGNYFQTVNILKNYIRIVAKGPKVIFDGKSTLFTAFTLSNVTGVAIEGMNIRNYRGDGIVIDSGAGNRIINNTIAHMFSNGIEVVASSGNLIWKNEINHCFYGVLLIQGSTSNWMIENVIKECLQNGFISFLDPDSNNAFISNTMINNRNFGMDIFGSGNLLLDNILINNTHGVTMGRGSHSLAIGNMIKGTIADTYLISGTFRNHFAAENNIVCNRRYGIQNNSLFGIFEKNEISYNRDGGIIFTEDSGGNLVMDNKFVCNIPENIADLSTNNNLINNKEKPCKPCESPSDICDDCLKEIDNSVDRSKECVY
ncbi:MAG: hypothetical protein GX024_05015 [Clostridiales bacterium]|nr:hypothetical protein [Clostridiales bacterium]